jgi:glucose-1-phosphate thymidylyltransferase
VRALVLAAGWGTRLGALGAAHPKALLPIGARTPLDFAVDALERLADLAAIDVVTHETARARFEAWAARRSGRCALRVLGNETHLPQQRRGAVGDLEHYLARERPGEPLLVLGGDMVFDFALQPLAARAPREAVIAVYDVGRTALVSRYASVVLDGSSRVVRFVEKDPKPTTTLAAPALYGLPADALGEVGAYLRSGGHPDNLGFFVEWLVQRRTVRGALLEGRWIDIGSTDEYERAQREFGGAGR